MSKSFMSYVWAYSKRAQILILLLTMAYFPILYITLELPKQIINDAISGTAFPVDWFGLSFSQLNYLFLLCCGYLIFVLIGGLLKMQTNTYKGIVSERMLRRFRFQLIRRILRFPLPYFRHTSQGSLISMVTAEAETVGGMMGEALARPLFSAGQMLTILTFLFVQNVWLGVAAIAIIPVQIYIVPKLQKKINLLNRKRVLEVRGLSEQIVETVKGVEDLRANGGVRYTLALFSKKFGDLFFIRLEIYKRKFFMKFLNNTLNQITPFFLLLIGGYLAINGQLTIGALAAALASYKDLLEPWRDLLAYYSQIQDTSLRYRTITEQFDPKDMIDESLLFDRPEADPDLTGDITLQGATVQDLYGVPVLQNMSGTFRTGASVAIKARNGGARHALAMALSRSVMLSSGRISIGEHDLSMLHQHSLVAGLGITTSNAALFHGNIERNAHMALWQNPDPDQPLSEKLRNEVTEALHVDNSGDQLGVSWVDPKIAGLDTIGELRDWWAHIIRELGYERGLQKRALQSLWSTALHPELASALSDLRETIAARLKEEGLSQYIHRFDYEAHNPALTAVENALYAIRRPVAKQPGKQIDPAVWAMIKSIGIADHHLTWSYDLLDTLVQTFNQVGLDHPMFQRLENITADSFEAFKKIYMARQRGEKISDNDKGLLVTLPLSVTAQELGEGFSTELKNLVVQARLHSARELQDGAGGFYEAIRRHNYNSSLSILENLIYGKVIWGDEVLTDRLQNVIIEELGKAGLIKDVLLLIGDVDVTYSGANMDHLALERITFVRAVIKKPSILIMDRPLESSLPEVRAAFRKNLRKLLPETTLIQLGPEIPKDQNFDQHFEIRDGCLIDLDDKTPQKVDAHDQGTTASSRDLTEKMQLLSRVDVLSNLEPSQLRLLAFGAEWFTAAKGDYLFRIGEGPDCAYLLKSGLAQLRYSDGASIDHLVSEVPPERMVGDLTVIQNQERRLDLLVAEDVRGLKIGKRVLNDVIENDAKVASSLLRTVAGYLTENVEELGATHRQLNRLKDKYKAQGRDG